MTTRNTILVDVDAAGIGWFLDATPEDHSEFHPTGDDALLALPFSEAYGRIDLLTVVAHELGHLLGFGHSHDDHVMAESLEPGVRLVVGVDDHEHGAHAAEVSAASENGEPAMNASVTVTPVARPAVEPGESAAGFGWSLILRDDEEGGLDTSEAMRAALHPALPVRREPPALHPDEGLPGFSEGPDERLESDEAEIGRPGLGPGDGLDAAFTDEELLEALLVPAAE